MGKIRKVNVENVRRQNTEIFFLHGCKTAHPLKGDNTTNTQDKKLVKPVLTKLNFTGPTV